MPPPAARPHQAKSMDAEPRFNPQLNPPLNHSLNQV